MRNVRLALWALVIACALTAPVRAQDAAECPNPEGWRPGMPRIEAKLSDHKKWLNKGGPGDPTIQGKANFCKANLSERDLSRARLGRARLSSGADLSGANLSEADLSGADLSGVDLSEANLSEADLSGADLSGVDLSEADLSGADLSGVDLRPIIFGRTNLSGADLSDANLEGVDLTGKRAMRPSDQKPANLGKAKLIRANLKGVDLTGVNLRGADLTDAFFEPALGKLPPVESVANARGLSSLRFDEPRALVKLRELFKDAGYREQERQLTYALKHGETLAKLSGNGGVSTKVDGAFNYLLFDLTTAWGVQPSRTLIVLAILIVFFTPAYWRGLVKPDTDGIWRIWSEDRRRQDLGNDDGDRPIELHGAKAWRTALYFSVLSAFHVGWRDLNVGNWISRIQRYEYTYRATGWVRTVSGIQSLLSVYLLAMWALTYFGRPFQ